jgi:hypothetical protein
MRLSFEQRGKCWNYASVRASIKDKEKEEARPGTGGGIGLAFFSI